MKPSDINYGRLLSKTARIASEYINSLPDRPVDKGSDKKGLRSSLGGDLPINGEDPEVVIERLAKDIEPGLLAMSGPRFFGYAIGGSFPASLAADWLVTAWDQNVPYFIASPGTAIVEDIAAKWLLEFLHLPSSCGVGFVTGASEAIYACLITARNEVLRRAGWDVVRNGLRDAPKINIVVSDQIHSTIIRALWMIGLGDGEVQRLPTDENLRIVPQAISEMLASCKGPTIVCAQAGCIDSGAFDPFPELASAVADHENAWLHIDGAIGLFAGGSDEFGHLTRGIELADSWDADGHKWFNMPYDSGIAIVKDGSALQGAMGGSHMGAYLEDAIAVKDRNPIDYGLQGSRRPRGVMVYAAFRSLGREGIIEHLRETCALARRMAERLAQEPGIEILNDVVLNRFAARFGNGTEEEKDDLTNRVVHRVQREGFCYPSTTGYKGKKTMLFSILGWCTSENDIDESAKKIIEAYRAELK